MKRILTKIISYVTICLVISSIVMIFEPIITPKMAVDQLNGGDSGFVQLELFQKIRRFVVPSEILIGLLMFKKEIIQAMLKKKGEKKNEEN